MENFNEVNLKEYVANPFKLIGDDWMLICAGDEKKCNTMTASWGGLGTMWHRSVSFIVIRPQRYTKEFIDSNDRFSLNFLDEKYKKTMGYLGSVSGRDEDKIFKSGLGVKYYDGIPFFNESQTVMVCKKLYAQNYDPSLFIDKTIDVKWYKEKDYHTMYISEVEKVFIKNNIIS